MKIKRKTIQLLPIYISVFLLLFLCFNFTIREQIYKSNTNILITLFFSLGFLFYDTLKFKLKTTKNFFILVFTIIFLIMTLINNYYIRLGNQFIPLIYSMLLFVPFLCANNERILKAFERIIPIFFIEHIFFTLFALVFKEIYTNTILPFLSGNNIILAVSQYKIGYNPGLTTHYSTNAIYLCTGFIFYVSKFIKNKNKKNLVMIILSLFCLMLTAKRGHLVFSVLAIFGYYLLAYKENWFKKYIKIIITFIVVMFVLFAISLKVPQVMNVFKRFESNNMEELMNGRNELYDLAITNWKKSIIVGNGWGSAMYYYHVYLYIPNKYNIDYTQTHNVFLQLLCETGILGFALFSFLVFKILFITQKICKSDETNSLVIFSYIYQLFFIFYCMTGNPLYDIQCYLIYFISIGIALFYGKKINRNGGFINEK